MMKTFKPDEIEYPRDFFQALIFQNSPYAFYLFQWVPYKDDANYFRLKMLHDVKTYDGRIEYGIWPNADSCGSFKDSEVEFIRISRKQFSHEWHQKNEPTLSGDFNERVFKWMFDCFNGAVLYDIAERRNRFLEESLELHQSSEGTREEAHALVDYTYDRPIGEFAQEVGGVEVTLEALCIAKKVGRPEAGWTELIRIEAPDVMERIRAKQASKPQFSPLPGSYPDREPVTIRPVDGKAVVTLISADLVEAHKSQGTETGRVSGTFQHNSNTPKSAEAFTVEDALRLQIKNLQDVLHDVESDYTYLKGLLLPLESWVHLPAKIRGVSAWLNMRLDIIQEFLK